MIGYNRKEISKLEPLDKNVMEPVLPGPLSRKIIMIISLVAGGKSFKEIAQLLGVQELTLKRDFLEMPSLPRPHDWNELFPEEYQEPGSEEDYSFEYDNKYY